MASSVSISNVSKMYENSRVIHNIDINIDHGEFVVLVGPSGCGKSTLLRMIAGLEDISGGEISIDGKVVNGLLPKDRDIAMVFQNYALYPHMTVKENMAFSMKVRHADKAQVEQRVGASASILGLQEYLDRYPRQLSGGQRQRVAMGRAIVRDPRLFLFDEPLSNLDAKLRVQMRMEIKALHQRLGTTFIYVTHDQVEAMTMADRIVVMRSGVIEQIGTPKELYDFPANQFVAGFIGSPTMNFVKGELQSVNGARGFVTSAGQSLPLSASTETVNPVPAIYGIRPEHLRIDSDGIPATVTVVETTGADTFVYCDMQGAQVCAALRDSRTFRPGDSVRLSPVVKSAHLFHAETGASLVERSRQETSSYDTVPSIAPLPQRTALHVSAAR